MLVVLCGLSFTVLAVWPEDGSAACSDPHMLVQVGVNYKAVKLAYLCLKKTPQSLNVPMSHVSPFIKTPFPGIKADILLILILSVTR